MPSPLHFATEEKYECKTTEGRNFTISCESKLAHFWSILAARRTESYVTKVLFESTCDGKKKNRANQRAFLVQCDSKEKSYTTFLFLVYRGDKKKVTLTRIIVLSWSKLATKRKATRNCFLSWSIVTERRKATWPSTIPGRLWRHDWKATRIIVLFWSFVAAWAKVT